MMNCCNQSSGKWILNLTTSQKLGAKYNLMKRDASPNSEMFALLEHDLKWNELYKTQEIFGFLGNCLPIKSIE